MTHFSFLAVLLAAGLALGALGCDESSHDAPTAEEPAESAEGADLVAEVEDEDLDLSEDTVPIEEDFQDEAEQEIVAANLDEKLAEIEAELSSAED